MVLELGRIDVMNMDRLKFCLSFDEKRVYKEFPNRVDNTYAKSIKKIIPTNPFICSTNINSINPGNFKTPSTKYYGVNFLKQQKNYLEFRYLGGENYEKKTQKILDLLDMFCMSIYDTLHNPEYTESDLQQLKNILKGHKKILEGVFSLEQFVYHFPNIILMVDLKGSPEILKSFWGNIKVALYDLVVNAGFSKGLLNYDTDAGKFQIKDSTLKNCNEISNYEIFNSYISGLINNCDFFDCTVENSHLVSCKLLRGNLVKQSKIKDTPINYNNKCDSCYIENKNTMINGNLSKCIIRHGEPSELCVLEDTTIIKSD
jgi:hypothetical protein